VKEFVKISIRSKNLKNMAFLPLKNYNNVENFSLAYSVVLYRPGFVCLPDLSDFGFSV